MVDTHFSVIMNAFRKAPVPPLRHTSHHAISTPIVFSYIVYSKNSMNSSLFKDQCSQCISYNLRHFLFLAVLWVIYTALNLCIWHFINTHFITVTNYTLVIYSKCWPSVRSSSQVILCQRNIRICFSMSRASFCLCNVTTGSSRERCHFIKPSLLW